MKQIDITPCAHEDFANFRRKRRVPERSMTNWKNFFQKSIPQFNGLHAKDKEISWRKGRYCGNSKGMASHVFA